MTKSEAMAKVKELMKQAVAVKKSNGLVGFKYQFVEESLNNLHLQLQLGKMTGDDAELTIQQVEGILAQAKQAKTESGGMTEEEYNKKKSELFKKVQSGEMTNYAYIQWKKQNKPDKQAQSGPVSASAAKDGTSTGTKAAGGAQAGITPKQKATVKHNLKQKFMKGELTKVEFDSLVDQLQGLEKSGATLQEANAALGLSKKKTTAQPKKAKTPITEDEVSALNDHIFHLYSDVKISKETYYEAYDKLKEMKNSGASLQECKDAIDAITKAKQPSSTTKAAGQKKTYMTDNEYEELWEYIDDLKSNGTIGKLAMKELVDTLDDLSGQGKSKEEVEKIINDAVQFSDVNGMPMHDAIEAAKNAPMAPVGGSSYDQLIDKAQNFIMEYGSMDFEDVEALVDMVEYLKDSGVDPAQAEMQLESAAQLMENNGFSVDEAMNIAAGYKKGMKAQNGNQEGPMTHDEYISVWEELNKKKKAGEITDAEYTEYGKVLDDLYQQKATLGTAKSAVNLAPVTDKQVNELTEQLMQKVDSGKMTFDEFSVIQQKALELKGQGKNFKEVQAAMGLDPGTLATEAAVDKLEKDLTSVYTQAAHEMKAQLQKLQDSSMAKLTEMKAKYDNGEITLAEFQEWSKMQLLQQNILRQKIDQCSGVLLNANQVAMGMVNGQQVSVFAENANYQAYQISKDANLNLMFAIYDEDTVKKLIKDQPELLPPKVVNGQKDQAWNREKIANEMVQAVIQGESIPKLARRVANDTASTNLKAMVRYARTAMTAAQNSGRMETLHRAQGLGIKCKKCWLATLDSRTRDSHQQMDEKTVGIDEKFPNGLMYPGDPSGAPAEVWNCRCTLTYEYEGYPADPTANDRLMYEEWDEMVPVTKKDKNGHEYQTQKTVHHRDRKLISDMSYPEWKAAKQGDSLNELNLVKQALAKAQKEIITGKISETKKYKDLWKDDVTLADYPAKKDSIDSKRDYYVDKLNEFEQAKADGKSWATDEKIKELEKKIKQLDEFAYNGELLEKRNEALKKVQEIYDKVGYQQQAAAPVYSIPKATKKASTAAGGTSAGVAKQSLSTAAGVKKTQFSPDAWDAKTKKAAAKYSRRVDADKDLRKELDDEWDQLSDAEKYACWEYTRNSNPMNKSLSGYHDSWTRSNFIGYDRTDWGYEDAWRSLPSNFSRFGKGGHATYHKAITDLTKAIEKTVFKKDRWLVRGSDNNGFAGMLEGAGMDFNQMKRLLDSGDIAKIRQALIGQKAINHAFTSTGIANDAGFGGEVKFSIYAPAGTKAIYAEPQSHYGLSMGGSDKIYTKGSSYRGVGSEAEVIIQRGTTYVIRNITKGLSGIVVEMEIVEQPDYFTHGDEDTYNGGKTRHKR